MADLDDPQFTIDAESHVMTVTRQRNRAQDSAAMWETIALQERAKVESLTAELIRLSDSNVLEQTPE